MASLRKASTRREIAKRLKKARVRAGLSKRFVSGQLNIFPQQYVLIERGEASIPSERIVDIAALVHTTTDDLLGIIRVAA